MPFTSTEHTNPGQFAANLLKDPYADLSVYTVPDDYARLREAALDKIHAELFKIHIKQVNDEASKHTFNLKTVINNREPENGCTLLDYCLIAGFDGLALHIASLGCETSSDTAVFERNIYTDYKRNQPEAIKQLLKTLESIKTGRENYKKNLSQEPLTFWQAVLAYGNANRKYSFLLLLLGISCIAASPFSGGWSSILLLSVGIPSVLASISAFQAADTAKKARDQISDQTRVYFEAKEVRHLLKLTRNLQEFNDNRLEKPLSTVIDNPHLHEAIDENEHRLIFINNHTGSEELDEIERTRQALSRRIK